MTGDPNWLLSTVAQSAAAIVAIIGGFLVSRVVGLAGQRESLQQAVRNLRDREAVASQRFDHLRDRVITWDAVDVMEAARSELVEAEGAIDLDEVFARFGDYSPGLKKEQLQPYYVMDRDSVLRAFERLRPVFQRDAHVPGPDPTETFEELGLGEELDADTKSIYTEVYKHLRRTERARRSFPLGIDAPIPPFVSALSAGDPGAARRQLLAERDEAERTHEALAAELRATQRELDRLGVPTGVQGALWVLAVFAVVGIVFPVALLATQPVRLSWEVRASVVVLFVAGLMAVLGFLLHALRQASPPNEHTRETSTSE